MIAPPEILGVVLAGGAGKRLFAPGEGDKALVNLAGEPLINRVIKTIAPQVGALILNANGDPGRFAEFGLPVISDLDADRAGPLAGFAAAFAFAERQPVKPLAILSVTADAPFLPGDLVVRLARVCDSRPAIAASGGRKHPTIGLWPLDIDPGPARALAEGRRRLEDFARLHEAIEVEFAFDENGAVRRDPFFNVNTQSDIEMARRLIAGQE